MNKILIIIAFFALSGAAVASIQTKKHDDSVSAKTQHAYQATKDMTVKIAKKSGNAIKSGYEHSKHWLSDKWQHHKQKAQK